MAYPGELNQVWTNLIDNATDAVNGTGKICIGTYLDGDSLVVEIVDDGVAFPRTSSRACSNRFSPPRGRLRHRLGLVISNRIVADRHHGEIEFESKPGETKFRVRLPARTL